MSLDRDTVVHLLPCYVCGDLPEPMKEQIRAMLRDDPVLAARAEALSGAEDVCRELLLAGLPAVSTPMPLARSASSGLAGALAWAAAAIGLVALSPTLYSAGEPPLHGLVELHAQVAPADEASFIAETDARRLAVALVEAGVPMDLAMVADLSEMGLQLIGGQPATGRLGALILYEKDGVRYVCQVYRALPAMSPLATQKVGASTVRSYQHGELGLVLFDGPGVMCVFSGLQPADRIMAMVVERLSSMG